MIVNESEYKGHPILEIRRTPEDKYPFRFGVGKAEMLLACPEEIKKFVEKHQGAKVEN